MYLNQHMCKYSSAMIMAIIMLCVMSPGISHGQEQGDLQKKLNSIIIEHVEFDNLPIRKAVEALRKLAKEADHEKKGINILLLLEKDKNPDDVRVTLNLDKIPLDAAIEYTAKSADLSYHTRGSIAIIAGKNAAKGAMETRTYPVSPTTINGIDAGKVDKKSEDESEKVEK